MTPLQLARKIKSACASATHGRLGKVTAAWAADLVRELEAALAWLARSLWSKAVRSQRNSIVTLALTPSPGANNQRPDASSLGYVALTTRRLRPRHCTATIDDGPTPHWEDPP